MSDNLHDKGILLNTLSSNSAGAQLQNSGNINIVLLGKTGVGKSSTGNTILGKNIFKCKRSLKSVTQSCQCEESVVNGRLVCVVDTPGFFDTTLEEEELAEELAKSVFLSAPGPHAFLFVLPADRFTEQEEEVCKEIELMFGQGVLKYLILLFTNGDDIDLKTFESEVNEHEKLRKIVKNCQGYHIFNNKDQTNEKQVNDLLTKIDIMIKNNEGKHYSNEMFKKAQRIKQEKQQRKEDQEISSCCGCCSCCNSAFKNFWENFKEFFRNIARKLRRKRDKYKPL